jgi:hypothetical protein
MNRGGRQKDVEAAESRARWAMSETVHDVKTIVKGLHMIQYNEKTNYQNVRANLTKWFVRCIIDKRVLAKEIET